MKISQVQIVGEGNYATIEGQFLYDGHMLSLCHIAALNSWARIEEEGKKRESFTKVIQPPPKKTSQIF